MGAPASFLATLTGLFAFPAADNPTGVMVEAAYRHHAIDARYLTCEVAPTDLGAAVRGAVAMGWAGFHLSLPHKVAALGLVDEVAPSARLIGAVNCVVVRDGRLVGENTDGQGFIDSLRTAVEPRGRRVLVLGAGGAARAVAVELALAGADRIVVANRTAERAVELAARVEAMTQASAEPLAWTAPLAIPREVDVVVNATSIGLYPDVAASPALDPPTLRPDLVVADIIPNPPRTALLAEAEAAGCHTLDGLGMLVGQAVIAIRHWTGVDADPAVMRAALADLFG